MKENEGTISNYYIFRETLESYLLQSRRISSSADQMVQRRSESTAGVHDDHRGQPGRAEQERADRRPAQEHGRGRVPVHGLEQSSGAASEVGDEDETVS